jgi:hypothetical protein
MQICIPVIDTGNGVTKKMPRFTSFSYELYNPKFYKTPELLKTEAEKASKLFGSRLLDKNTFRIDAEGFWNYFDNDSYDEVGFFDSIDEDPYFSPVIVDSEVYDNWDMALYDMFYQTSLVSFPAKVVGVYIAETSLTKHLLNQI